MRIGVDLGGTKIEAVVLGEDGEVVARRRIATPQDDYAETLAAVVAIVRDLEAEADAGDAASASPSPARSRRPPASSRTPTRSA